MCNLGPMPGFMFGGMRRGGNYPFSRPRPSPLWAIGLHPGGRGREWGAVMAPTGAGSRFKGDTRGREGGWEGRGLYRPKTAGKWGATLGADWGAMP